jgi:hypothetical protein
VPHFLSDPPVFLQLVVILATAATAFVWWRERSRKAQVALGIVFALAIAFFAVSHFWESPREQATTRVRGVIAAMNRYDAGQAMAHVSDRFDYRGCTKGMLRQAELNRILRQYNAVLSAHGFTRDGVQYSPDGNSCTIPFNVTVSGDIGSRPFFYVEATVVKDPDGEFRLAGFKVWENSLQGRNSSEFVVPGLGR